MPLPAFLTGRPSSPRRLLVAGLVALLAVGGVAAVAGGQSSSAGYRTATVGPRSVDQVLDGVATIEPVDQASVAFPVAGTVDSVAVGVGDRVGAGTELAELDVTSLERALRQEQAELDAAALNLERALDGESVATDPDGAAMEPTAVAADTTAELEVELVAAVSGPTDGQIAAAQQAVVAAQAQVGSAQGAAQAAVANATSVCGAVGQADQAGFPAALTACTDAITAVAAAQQAVTDAQTAVSAAAATLDGLLAARADALAETPTEPTEPTGPSTPAAPSGDTGTLDGGSIPNGGDRTGGSSATAEQLIALQRRLDAAALEVIVAQQAVAQATIVSPIRGTVAAVNLAVGDEVDAASSTAGVVVVGPGGYEATFSVSVDDLPDLEVGQTAEVRADGVVEPLAGEVVAIGVAANESSYPVTVGFTEETGSLGNGSTASVTVTTDAADDALAIPTSAVTLDGQQATVEVFDGEGTSTVDVEIGAVGDTWTEVTSGLDEGQEVVLADLDEPLPSSATDTSEGGVGRPDSIFQGGGPPGGGPVQLELRPGG
jgi:HlyD family secretion protein